MNSCFGKLKKDAHTGALTNGHVKRILTNSPTHPHGIKVMLGEDDAVGRVQEIIENEPLHAEANSGD